MLVFYGRLYNSAGKLFPVCVTIEARGQGMAAEQPFFPYSKWNSGELLVGKLFSRRVKGAPR